MCCACGNMCCGSDMFGGCGCEHCDEPECWGVCEGCGQPDFACDCDGEEFDDVQP